MLQRIYGEYIGNISRFIEENAAGELENELQFHIVLSNIMMTQVFGEAKTRSFYLEISEGELIPEEIHETIRSRQMRILEYYHVDISPQNFYWCAIAEYGARRQLIRLNRNIAVDGPEFREFLDLLSTISVRVDGLMQSIIQKDLERANEVFCRLDYSHLHMFE